jgi:hypothetical protein
LFSLVIPTPKYTIKQDTEKGAAIFIFIPPPPINFIRSGLFPTNGPTHAEVAEGNLGLRFGRPVCVRYLNVLGPTK